MKIHKIMILVSLVAMFSCSGDKSQLPANVVNIPNTASGKADESQLPAFEFMDTEHDFGKVIQGEIVTYSFRFKNVGNSDLLIANISTSCGCTVSNYPKTPIKPGAEDKIEVTFDSDGKQGFQNKTLSVAANTQPSTTNLTIKAMVFLPEKQ
jgi:hypothetical protein